MDVTKQPEHVTKNNLQKNKGLTILKFVFDQPQKGWTAY